MRKILRSPKYFCNTIPSFFVTDGSGAYLLLNDTANTESVNREQQKVMLIIVLGYILPVLLIYLGLVPFTWRFYILIVAAVAILAIARLYRFSAVELGFTPQNFRNSLKAGYHYTKYRSLYRNLYSIIVSHSVLGAIAILVGLV